MGTKNVIVTVCDLCAKERTVIRWRITRDGTGRTVELCAPCSAPLERLYSKNKGGLFQPVPDAVIEEARARRLEGGA